MTEHDALVLLSAAVAEVLEAEHDSRESGRGVFATKLNLGLYRLSLGAAYEQAVVALAAAATEGEVDRRGAA